jgi:hypothetical protein
MSDTNPATSAEVTKTDAITGTRGAGSPDGTGDADVVDRDASNASLTNADDPQSVGGPDSSETEETDDVGASESQSPGVGVSDVDLADAEAEADAGADSGDLGTGEELGVDREEQFRLANDLATNDAVAGETVLGEGAPVDEAPYQGDNELGGDVDLGETEER